VENKHNQNTLYPVSFSEKIKINDASHLFLDDDDRNLYMQFVNDQSSLNLNQLIKDENLPDEEIKAPYFTWTDPNSDSYGYASKIKNENEACWASDPHKIERIYEIQSNIRLAERLYDNANAEPVDLNSIMNSNKEYHRSSGSIFCASENNPIRSKQN
jgi:hypothetical protein